MSFQSVEIKDRIATGDDLFFMETQPDGRVKLISAPDDVTESGTDINKQLLQPIEDTLEQLDTLMPIVCVKERRSGIIPLDTQIQDNATVIGGCYASCSSTLLGSDNFNGIVQDENSAIAVIPVLQGHTYTVFFPGVTSVEVLQNALALKTFKRLFRGFIVIEKAYALDSFSAESVAEWISDSVIKLDGYSKCETGTSNSDLFNSGYYATFTVPNGADTVIFNAALSETSESAKIYDLRDTFIVFEGTMSDTAVGDIKFVSQLGNLVVRDIETANAVKNLETDMRTFDMTAIESDSFIDFESGFQPSDIRISLTKNQINAHFRCSVVSLTGSLGCFKIGTIKSEFAPIGVHVGMVNVTAQSGDDMRHISGCGYINNVNGDGNIYIILDDSAYYEYLDVNIVYFLSEQEETV